MSLKRNVKQRRLQKIKRLMEQSATKVQEEESSVLPIQSKPSFSSSAEERDPELVWKQNSNPWLSWHEAPENSSIKRFIHSPAPSHSKTVGSGGMWRTFLNELRWKIIVALILFMSIWSIFQYNNEWTLKGQALVKQAMTEEIDFAAAAVWYNQTFAGAPSFIPIFKDHSGKVIGVDGKVKLVTVSPLPEASLIRTFAELLNGIELAGPSAGQVVAAETGRVLLVTNDPTSIIIQHANKRVSVYGGLGTAEVKVNDWVEAGDPIGRLLEADDGAQSLLYFSIKENEQYVDPLDVISLD